MLAVNNTTKYQINLKKISGLAEKFLRAYKKTDREISLAIIGDARMKRLNREYRGINKTTDVLSFGAEKRGQEKARPAEPARSKYLGEIIINIQEARRVAKYQGMFAELGLIDPADKINAKIKKISSIRIQDYLFYFLLIHGLLHLIGYDDATVQGRREMLERGQKFLSKNL
ncbi:MAG: rRNA maturation RNase YbeY [Patescibacteria group bacterium]